MPRPLRLIDPNGYYHVTVCGNDGRALFHYQADARNFLARMTEIACRHDWICLAYCLMTNHYHLLLRAPAGAPSLSRGMQKLNGDYSRAQNRRYGHKHHLFRNRFGTTPVARDAHLLEACRYVVLNPVRAGLVDHPADWPWSSYRASAGLDLAPRVLALGELLGLFAADPTAAARAYRDFVAGA
jgi:putative transposase